MLSASFFRRLAFLTAFFAYLQIALGGVVRVTGSGLGCPDWPLCHGRPYPAADIHSVIEYSHRTVGAVTGLLLVATVVLAWVVFRRQRPVVASEADESCRSWPLCGSGFGLDFSGANGFAMLHRGAVLAVGVLLVYALVAAIRSEKLRPVAAATLAVFALQVAVGAGAAVSGAAFFNGLHVAIATLVWAGILSIALLTLPRADRSPAFARLAVDKRPA